MNRTSQRNVSLLILIFLSLMLFGCSGIKATSVFEATLPGQAIPPQATPAPVFIESPGPAYSLAQATLDAGKNQLLDLSRKSTQNSLNMSQAANAAAQSTKDYNQRQKADLDYQATIVSLNMAQAAATQKFILQQTKIAEDVAAAARRAAADATQSAFHLQSSQTAQAQAILNAQALQTDQAEAALMAYSLTATYSAQMLNVTETAQAQAILNAQAAQAAQVIAAKTAYPLTATPLSLTQAALLNQQYGREQQSFVDQIVVPLIPILAVLDLVAFILVILLANRRYISAQRGRSLRIEAGNGGSGSLIMIDGVISDPLPLPPLVNPPGLQSTNSPSLPGKDLPHVEILDATEPPVAHWIAEVEHQMEIEGGQVQ